MTAGVFRHLCTRVNLRLADRRVSNNVVVGHSAGRSGHGSETMTCIVIGCTFVHAQFVVRFEHNTLVRPDARAGWGPVEILIATSCCSALSGSLAVTRFILTR